MLTKSEQMARVKSRDTAPERLVRRLLTSYGLRYRLHRKDLPGKPDLYIARLRLAIFVNGCFWHGHAGCPRATLPKTNADFWSTKIQGNIARDQRTKVALARMGIKTFIIWTCNEAGVGKTCKRIAGLWKTASHDA